MSQLFSPQSRRLNLLAMVYAQRSHPVSYQREMDAACTEAPDPPLPEIPHPAAA